MIDVFLRRRGMSLYSDVEEFVRSYKLQIHKLEPWQYIHEQMEDPEIFCSMFREFMALLYSDDVPYGYLSIMTNVVEGALDLYLGRHNISIYGNGNNMKDAVIYIRKAMEKTNMLYGM